uniref:Putative secreted protein n=1 Tax=Amblyomma americanum TaxID=6943 RepID=A0A0C9RXJ6_AMBAM
MARGGLILIVPILSSLWNTQDGHLEPSFLQDIHTGIPPSIVALLQPPSTQEDGVTRSDRERKSRLPQRNRIMRLPICAALLLAASSLWCRVEACRHDEKWSFCPREGTPNDDLCPGLWTRTCAWLSIQCGCLKQTYRHENGSCVPRNQCYTSDGTRRRRFFYPSSRKPSLRRRRG